MLIMSINRIAILNEKQNSDSISQDIIKKISIILKYVDLDTLEKMDLKYIYQLKKGKNFINI